jgi:hypothetical protein
MEKKNTILLTVIAIATLLVAVVGATFAYFTATVNTTNKDNATTTVTTKTLASATFDYGKSASATGVLPGYHAVKKLNVKGACDESSCQDVNAVITVTPSIGSLPVTWKLYKSSTAISCTTVPVTDGGQYYDNGVCTGISEDAVVLSGDSDTKTLDVVVSSTTNDDYYLVVTYANTGAAQDSEQGASFNVALNFAAKN